MRRVLITLCAAGAITGCHEKNAPGPLYDVRCSEPVPPFQRSSHVPRTPELDAKLCECIWAKLDSKDRTTAEKMFKGEWDQIPCVDRDRYASHAGQLAVDCGP